MLEKLIKLFHLLDEEKECLIWDSIDEKDSDIFPDEFQNTKFFIHSIPHHNWKF